MEVLACPYCDRMFHAAPAILGKAIRCRECRKTFRVPADLTSLELGPNPESARPKIPVAVECFVQGVDTRMCPACSRVFSMQSKFIGKKFQCRGCRAPFVVHATSRAATAPSQVEESPKPEKTVVAKTLPDASPGPAMPDTLAEPPRESADDLPPVIHDDGGDVLSAEPAGEPILVAVRPRRTWKDRKPLEPIRGPFRSGQF